MRLIDRIAAGIQNGDSSAYRELAVVTRPSFFSTTYLPLCSCHGHYSNRNCSRWTGTAFQPVLQLVVAY